MKKIKNEYNKLTEYIINNKHFIKTKEDVHHGSTKYEHLIRVSKCSYIMSKILRANTKTCVTAGLLHDLFYGERTDKEENSYLNHPNTAAFNAYVFFDINDEEKEAIKTHMFHHVIFKKLCPMFNRKEKANLKESKPASKEAWIVSISDLLVSIYESSKFIEYKLNIAFVLLFSAFSR